MQRHELLISSIIAHAARHHGDGEIVSRRADGSLARTSYHVLEPDVLREFCHGKLPDWSLPDRVVIADSLPHGATGKILKTELRRIYAGG